MEKAIVKKIPYQSWMSEEAKKVVDDFNNSGNKLTLAFFDFPYGMDEIDLILEEGQYDFEYPDCPEAEMLKVMVEEAENAARFLGFDVEDLIL